MNTADFDTIGRNRELGFAMWRVSALEHILQTHRSRQSRGEVWNREETSIVRRLQFARAELSRLSRPHSAARFELAA